MIFIFLNIRLKSSSGDDCAIPISKNQKKLILNVPNFVFYRQPGKINLGMQHCTKE